MSYSSDSSSREAIQAIQFELWPDCNNGCTYCYLKGTQRVTTRSFKLDSILKTQEVLNNLEIYNYDMDEEEKEFSREEKELFMN